MLRRAYTPVLRTSVNLPHPTNANRLAEVDVASNSGSTGIEPVGFLWRKLLRGASLDELNPACTKPLSENFRCHRVAGKIHTRNGELALALQKSTIGLDELLRLTREQNKPLAKHSVSRDLSAPSRLLSTCSLLIVSLLLSGSHDSHHRRPRPRDLRDG